MTGPHLAWQGEHGQHSIKITDVRPAVCDGSRSIERGVFSKVMVGEKRGTLRRVPVTS
jgi:hypothetical protein